MNPQNTQIEAPIIVSDTTTEQLLEHILQNGDQNAKDTQSILEHILVQSGQEDQQTPVLEHQLVKLGEVKEVLVELLNEYKKPCTVNLILE